MIQIAGVAQKNELMALYNEGFKGDEAFCEWYFNSEWQAESCLIYVQNGVICAMLNMIEYQMQIKQELVNCTYFFALVTKQDMRGKGIMSELIAFAIKFCEKNGVKLASLIVQTQSLFKFYDAVGFVKRLYVSRCKCKANLLPQGFSMRLLTDTDFEIVNLIYENALKSQAFAKRHEAFWRSLMQSYGKECYLLFDENAVPVAYCIGGAKAHLHYACAECMGEGAAVLMAALAHNNALQNAEYNSAFTQNNLVAIGSVFLIDKSLQMPQKSFLNLMYN